MMLHAAVIFTKGGRSYWPRSRKWLGSLPDDGKEIATKNTINKRAHMGGPLCYLKNSI